MKSFWVDFTEASSGFMQFHNVIQEIYGRARLYTENPRNTAKGDIK